MKVMRGLAGRGGFTSWAHVLAAYEAQNPMTACYGFGPAHLTARRAIIVSAGAGRSRDADSKAPGLTSSSL